MIRFNQWDIVKVRIRPDDRDEHYCVVISPDEVCHDERKPLLNILSGSTLRPADTPSHHEIILNGSDGLERRTVFNCVHFHQVNRARISAVAGTVAPIRRVVICRKIAELFRFRFA
jgi:hypothetical protein